MLLIIFIVPSLAFSGTISFREAEACRGQLTSKTQAKKPQTQQTQWERCIKLYLSTPSFHRKDGRAAFEIARLYEERHQFSHQLNDLQKAKQYYEMVLAAAPRSYFYLDAKRKLTNLEPLLRTPRHPLPKKTKPVELINIRHHDYDGYTRIVLDLNRPVSYKASRLGSSQTLIVYLEHAVSGRALQKTLTVSATSPTLKKIELDPQDGGKIEVRLIFKSFGSYKLTPIGGPDRLVVDVFRSGDIPLGIPRNESQIMVRATPPPPLTEIKTIVIDPGHGGKDPGTIGTSGLTEKEVVLDISIQLKHLLQKRLKRTVLMTREEDVFIPLEERTNLANEKKVDLFISVHANAHPDQRMQGVEIYLVGQSTDAAARATAARENMSDEQGPVSFQEAILESLEDDFNFNTSLEIAHMTEKALLEKLSKKYATVSLGVKRAPFYVLAKTHMPAILAEISFLSNPKEEKRLKSPKYRQAIAEALYKGIATYIRFSKNRA